MTRFQLTATYQTNDSWQGEKPASCLASLPGFQQKVSGKNEIKILVYGDSISCGYDCSVFYGFKPCQPVWPILLKNDLSAYYEVKIELINTSVGGTDTEWALEHIQQRVCCYHPDLILLGFGMNDRCPGTEYARKTEELIHAIKKACSDTEFVLMATSLPNPLVNTAPYHFTAYQDEYADALRPLCGSGIVLADIQSVQKTLMKKKRYIDLTGNLLNHPNDYMARIQAQVVATILKP